MQVISSHGLAAPMLADIEPDLPVMPSTDSGSPGGADAAPESVTPHHGEISIDENPVGKFAGSIVVPLEFQGCELGVFSLFAAVLLLRTLFNGIHQPLIITLMLSTARRGSFCE